ncbi:ATP-binding protein [Planctomyces sp. SH-PL62]|uniref:hybrid sensor histidine kinase/response regulator n=1 Tax=Planctomyces sp. SH-PL62 TaxID=1636152 RepID=UPI00078CE173|nr:ATP-binding protein [Planctomyces sp. SH-PL62]AMV40788.1 Autoinducer 2 sensor kinase/phosphatase LuxQ [Planctomyces sp. SH-PL62]
MVDDLAAEIEDRILLLPPTRRDADAAAVVFRKAGLALTLCGDVADLCAEIERGAAVALLPAEAVLTDREGRLARVLGEQPPWSDFPLITLMHPTQSAASIRELEQLGPMTLVRRPIEIRSLVSTVRAALRDRRRQYDRRADFIERERQAQALRENDRHKDEFLAMLAHELRNPLAAVNNAVAVLKRSGDPASQAWASGIVERQMRQLVRLIDDLLDVARINGGKIRLQTTLVDAGPILDQAIESVRPQVDERRQTLTVAIERGRLPLNVDAPRVAQIVLNLLSNASKYGEPGGRIWLTARPEGEAAVISVRDDGMGIPPDKLPEMFRLFAQGDRSLARSEGGLGIGLTIVMRLAEMHGGSVEARSDGPGEGSEFIVRLPLARAAASPCATSAPPSPPPSRAARILVVDDNLDTASGMVQFLQILGHEVVAAHDGHAAVASAHDFRPDVVLLDVGLPGMDGYQVASALRRDEAHRRAVLIAVTGYGQEEDRRRSRDAGFDHHLVKPVDFDVLASLIGEPG